MCDVKRFRVTRFRVHLIQSKTMEFDADSCEHIVHNFGNSYRWTLGDTEVACVTTGNLAGWVTVAPKKDRGPVPMEDHREWKDLDLPDAPRITSPALFPDNEA